MRNAFIRALAERAATDERIVFLTGDLGFRAVEPMQEAAPERYFNVGIAEQNMVEVAAGLAQEGLKPFIYSIGSFASLRCLEQIRVCLAYHDLDVTILSVGAGVSYGHLGVTHWSTEDIACVRSLPNTEVYTPADFAEVEAVVERCLSSAHPAYVRLGRGGEHLLPRIGEADGTHEPRGTGGLAGGASEPRVADGLAGEPRGTGGLADGLPPIDALGLVERTRFGDGGERIDVALLATGAVATQAVAAAERLGAEGRSGVVCTAPSIKPLDVAGVLALARRSRAVVCVEEGSVVGGFGSAVAEAVAGEGLATPVVRLGMQDAYPDVIGSQGYLWHLLGMDADAIVATAREMFARN